MIRQRSKANLYDAGQQQQSQELLARSRSTSTGLDHAVVPTIPAAPQPPAVPAHSLSSTGLPGGLPKHAAGQGLSHQPASWYLQLTRQYILAAAGAFSLLVAGAVLAGIILSRPAAAAAAAAPAQQQPQQPSSSLQCDSSSPSMPFFEDFNSSSLDPCVWRYDIGDGTDYGKDLAGWGNNELQCYTSSPANVDIIPNPDRPGDGLLRIRSVHSQQYRPCQNRVAAAGSTQWTSGKVDTKGRRTFRWLPANGTAGAACTPVVVEARIKLPYMRGRWSAFWMMPAPQLDVSFAGCPSTQQASSTYQECGAYGPWPRSGEIDIMEQTNMNNKVLGTVHYATPWGQHAWLGDELAMSSEALQGFNVYRVVWGCDSIRWLVNDMQMHNITRGQFAGQRWPFDQPFFVILNTAVGGLLAGNDVDTAVGTMLVDYVKVYYGS